jgi:Zn-dependent peptidase ImmA (M78 family)
MQDRKVMILGTEWTIKEMKENDSRIKDYDGYTYNYEPIILIDYSVDKENVKHALRHEIIHAFKKESGLVTCEVQNDEQQVDWIAHQLVKIHKVYKELKIL